MHRKKHKKFIKKVQTIQENSIVKHQERSEHEQTSEYQENTNTLIENPDKDISDASSTIDQNDASQSISSDSMEQETHIFSQLIPFEEIQSSSSIAFRENPSKKNQTLSEESVESLISTEVQESQDHSSVSPYEETSHLDFVEHQAPYPEEIMSKKEGHQPSSKSTTKKQPQKPFSSDFFFNSIMEKLQDESIEKEQEESSSATIKPEQTIIPDEPSEEPADIPTDLFKKNLKFLHYLQHHLTFIHNCLTLNFPIQDTDQSSLNQSTLSKDVSSVPSLADKEAIQMKFERQEIQENLEALQHSEQNMKDNDIPVLQKQNVQSNPQTTLQSEKKDPFDVFLSDTKTSTPKASENQSIDREKTIVPNL